MKLKRRLEITTPQMLPISIEDTIQSLSANAQSIGALVGATSEIQARYKPSPEEWSILEQVNHLYDEERLDFRFRLNFILEGTKGECPPIDPPGWVVEHRYNERDLRESTDNFLKERKQSIDWLKTLDSFDPQKSYTAKFGTITAGDMLYSWVMHDLLHLRQLADSYSRYHAEQVKPYSVQYAG